jgi:uncharacterized protein (TIRG00374 family)
VQQAKKRWFLFAAKLAVSVGVMVLIFRKVLAQENIGELWVRVTELSWGWIGLAAAALWVAIGCGVLRWRLLLAGQGIHAPFRHLLGSWMIGRFFGAVTPAGLGLNGYRLYDIASRTGKVARATAQVGIETVIGSLAMFLVIVGGSVFGLRYLGQTGVILLNVVFLGAAAAAFILLARPGVFRWVAQRLPVGTRTRVRTLVEAVCAYQGRTGLLAKATLLSVGVHTLNNFIYVCTARALGVELGIGEVFFVSSLQIFATLLPISIGGVGVREAAAVSLYTIVGVPAGVAVLIPIVGIVVEYSISAIGGLVLLARRHHYQPAIQVDDADREEMAHEEIPTVSEERWPVLGRGAVLGLGAGLLAGALVGIAEGAVVVASSAGTAGYGVLAYGAVAYALLCGPGGAILGTLSAWSGRLLQRAAAPEPRAYAHMVALMVSTLAFALGAFRIRRDVFHEELVWKSPQGLLVLVACLAAAAVLYAAMALLLRLVTERRPGQLMLRAWGSPAVVGTLVVALGVGGLLAGAPAEAAPERPSGAAAPALAGNVLLIVVDTLRADALPSYGYAKGSTPHLDAFAEEAIRFDQAFTNSSWTRPSFASILTGRFASSHNVMSKADALSDELVTLPEALQGSGYETAGFVTNYNIAPFFNFHQGFHHYEYLEPDYVLGADDTASKLLLVQSLRRVVEKIRGAQPGLAYQDAETVNRTVLQWLDRGPSAPFFLMAAYMDPHDPYFAHPYQGEGYSRAANQQPDPAHAPRMRALYDGEITYWDAHFGQLVAELKERGLYDDLTILVTSDHGEEFMEHGGFWHGTTLYDEQVRVPFFLKLPGGDRGGSVVRHWVQSVDIMPSLLTMNGVPVPEGVQGGDIFKGTSDVYAEESHEGNQLESLRTLHEGDALKLITANPGNPRGLPPRELFDMARDPGEQENLSLDHPQAGLVEERLTFWAEQAREGAVLGESVDVDLDPAAAARLRNLGYVDD